MYYPGRRVIGTYLPFCFQLSLGAKTPFTRCQVKPGNEFGLLCPGFNNIEIYINANVELKSLEIVAIEVVENENRNNEPDLG